MQKIKTGFVSLALIMGIIPTWASASDTQAATAKEVIAKVHAAAKYLHNKGQAGFPDFNNNADWVWKDSYVFIYSCRDNKMIAHPLRPDLVGKPVLQMEDDKGNLLFQELCKASSKANGGWVEYWWPKPGEGKASRKISYTQRTEVSFQPDVRVGAGIYDDTMSVEELNKLAKQAVAPKKDAP
ncbi:MAG: calcium:proton antiporter [Candidatus Contendobacter odensis]|uniref:Calcium:proton antiporter n=1 Tax=Candidatus Contendibacter odensensis TaxID=1400860 RepID=A0A2G6PEA9_9GAMM|nr:MAG: calcium:proton antiporter [Candidatus Contendobacter odensis]